MKRRMSVLHKREQRLIIRLVRCILRATIVKRHHADYKTRKQNQIRHDIEIVQQVNRVKQDKITQINKTKKFVSEYTCTVSIKPYAEQHTMYTALLSRNTVFTVEHSFYIHILIQNLIQQNQ